MRALVPASCRPHPEEAQAAVLSTCADETWRRPEGRGRTREGQLPRQGAGAHEVLVDGAGALAAFADRPHDQRLTAAHVAAGEDVRDRGLVVRHVSLDVATRIERGARLVDKAGDDWAGEAHREQDKIGF